MSAVDVPDRATAVQRLPRLGYIPALDGLRGARGRRRAPLPRRCPLDSRRIPRRRRVLRDQRLPHHVPAARRLAPVRAHGIRAVLPPPRPMAAPRVVPDARRGQPLLDPVPARHRHGASRAGVRGDRVRRELVADLPRRLVLRGRGSSPAVPSRVVVGGGGAVLPPVAVDPGGAAATLGPRPPQGDRRGARPRVALHRAHGGAVRAVLRSVAGVLRHRHPRLDDAHRRAAGVHLVAVAAHPQHRQGRPARARCVRGRRSPRRGVVLPQRGGVRPLDVSRRIHRARAVHRPAARRHRASGGPGRPRGVRGGAVALGRGAVVRDLPVALADLHDHPTSFRPADHGIPAPRAPARAHPGRGHALLPIRGRTGSFGRARPSSHGLPTIVGRAAAADDEGLRHRRRCRRGLTLDRDRRSRRRRFTRAALRTSGRGGRRARPERHHGGGRGGGADHHHQAVRCDHHVALDHLDALSSPSATP